MSSISTIKKGAASLTLTYKVQPLFFGTTILISSIKILITRLFGLVLLIKILESVLILTSPSF